MSHANTCMCTPYTHTRSHTCSFSKMALSTSCMLSFTCKMASYSRCSREVLGEGGRRRREGERREGGSNEGRGGGRKRGEGREQKEEPPQVSHPPQLSIAYTVLYVETHIFDCTVASLSSSSALSPFSSAASLCTTSSLERVHKHYNQTRGHPPIRFCHSSLGSPGTVSTHFPSKSALVMCMRWTLSSIDCS